MGFLIIGILQVLPAIIILLAIIFIIQFIYYKFTKMGQAEYNKIKHDKEQFINKWGKK